MVVAVDGGEQGRGAPFDGAPEHDADRVVGTATATAHANIALIKYWGKADERLIIPRTSSLSLTLDGLSTRTTVEFLESPDSARTRLPDTLAIDGSRRAGSALERVSRFLDIVRAMAGINRPARVESHNTVPFGAGLASSASAFAALAAASSQAAGLRLSAPDLSRLARRGSGSSCRSIYGGLVLWNAGHDDESSYAQPVPTDMDLAIIVIMVSAGEKPLPSREAMRRTVQTSPLYRAWADSSADDLRQALNAVAGHDLQRLGEISEANALGMHATMISARPAVLYWLPQSAAALHAVEDIRGRGLPAWSTMDAGPNVKVLTDVQHANRVADELRDRLPHCEIRIHRAGPGVHVGESADPPTKADGGRQETWGA
ncbi:MAG: diphosphomevalonate decarboxylase [Bifidobacterium minimum]|jgi:diphosphomevalonate decarboxylase|nr:diphosphomevalonate decarboxylase [Bifidobacterium minimum]